MDIAYLFICKRAYIIIYGVSATKVCLYLCDISSDPLVWGYKFVYSVLNYVFWQETVQRNFEGVIEFW